MKKILFAFLGAALMLVSCQEKPAPLFNTSLQMVLDGQNAAISGLAVTMSDGAAEFTAETDANGQATFTVPAGAYNVTVKGTTFEDGVRNAYNGSASIAVSEDKTWPVTISKSVSSQLIIKEVYTGGCQKNDASGGFANDKYIILYNNSESEVDASNTVITFAAPYNGNGANKYYVDGKLLYENLDWIPSYGAIWWFTSPVKIPAYSQIVIAVIGAIDQTETYTNSVDLSNPEYYWMSNEGITAYTSTNYKVSDKIQKTHYLTCAPFTQGTSWALSVSAPAVYIGKMDSATALNISQDANNYDATLGTSKAYYVVKFPKANVVDALEVWSGANIDKSQVRFSADINSGYVAMTATYQGYTLYRNVDKAATEALPENEGKLVYGYSGGTADIEKGSTDPSGIDAEASIKAGAHIIYSDTNNSATDFHQRKVASIKK